MFTPDESKTYTKVEIQDYIDTRLDSDTKISTELALHEVINCSWTCFTCPIAVLLTKKYGKQFTVTSEGIWVDSWRFTLPPGLTKWIQKYDEVAIRSLLRSVV